MPDRVIVLVKDGTIQNVVADIPIEVLLLEERGAGVIGGQKVIVDSGHPDVVAEVIAAVNAKTQVVLNN